MDIPQEVLDLYYQTVDDFNDKNFGVNCKLFYPEKRVDCPNCIFDVFQKKSSGKYQSGGPEPFDTGVCPYCNDIGYQAVEDTDTIKMRVYFDKKAFLKVGVPLNVQDGSVMTIGKIVDLPKIIRCTGAILNTDVAGYKTYKYELKGEPILHGIKKDHYFIAIWQRTL